MKGGAIKVADSQGVFVIKMLGDVRLTLSLSFDRFIEEMFQSTGFSGVVFDLREADAVDSTTLGLMAKISLKGRAEGLTNPVVVATNRNVTRVLDSMGFAEIFEIVESADIEGRDFIELSEDGLDEQKIKEKVLEAHRVLVDLNQRNQNEFKELLQSLEGNQ